MEPEFIPFDSDEELPNKRNRLSKEEQTYGVFYEKQKISKPNIKIKKALSETELENTYGKGFSLLQKCGYKVGDGLGKNSQGRTDIIGVNIRKKNEGLSFSKCEIASTPVEKVKTDPDLKYKKRKTFKYDQPSGNEIIKTSDSEEILDENNENRKKIQIVQDSLLSLEYEEKQLRQGLIELEQKELEIYEILECLDLPQDSFEEIIKIFDIIKKKNHNIYHDLYIHENFVIPIIRSFFAKIWTDWAFNKDHLKGLSELKEWKQLGQANLVIDIWLKSVLEYFNKKWKPKKELGKNIDALEVWKQEIPIDTWEEIKKCIVLRISLEIDVWDPSTDRIAIHTWIHPWLALIDLSSLWSKLTNKLIISLQNWKPRDRSAKFLLYPWKPVLYKEWNGLIIQNILPKLLFTLQELAITEDIKESKDIRYILEWVGLIPLEHLQIGFQKIFYPKWRTFLENMLENNEDIEKIAQWVEDWKKLLPNELINLDI